MKKIIVYLIALLIVVNLGANALAKVIYTYGDWNIQVVNNEYCISSYNGFDSEVTVPDNYMGQSITAVLGYAFVGNKAIKSVTFSDGITTIGTNVFLSATSLTEVHFPSTIVEIGEEAFSDTPALSSINLSDTKITSVRDKTFLNSGISDIELPKTCSSIGEKAFGGCTGLVRIFIPASVTEIAENSFTGCSNLTIYCYQYSAAHQYAVAKNIPFVLLDAEPEGYLLGDTDNNEDVDVVDATWLQRYVALMNIGVIEDTVMQGDVDGDGDPTVVDATFIMRYAVGIDTPYTIGEFVSVD